MPKGYSNWIMLFFFFFSFFSLFIMTMKKKKREKKKRKERNKIEVSIDLDRVSIFFYLTCNERLCLFRIEKNLTGYFISFSS